MGLRRQVLRRRDGGRPRFLHAVVLTLGFVTCLIMLIVGGFYLRLSLGPLAVGKLPETVVHTLAERIGPGWTVSVSDSFLQLYEGSPALRIDNLEIRNPAGVVVLRAPRAAVSVALTSLLFGQFSPRAVEIDTPSIRLSINSDGSLSVLPADELPAEITDGMRSVQVLVDIYTGKTTAPEQMTAKGGPSPVSVAAQQIMDQVAGNGGFLGTLSYAKVTNARLTLVDSTQFVRARFETIDAYFMRTSSGGRRFESSFSGLRGKWRLSGQIETGSRAGDYSGEVQVDEAPVQDVLFLTGLSSAPFSTTTSVSGHLDIVLRSGRMQLLDGELQGHGGIVQIHDKDTGPFDLDDGILSMSWNEPERTLLIKNAYFKGGQTKIQLEGQLKAGLPDAAWRLELHGKDAVLSGESGTDAPVILSSIEAVVAQKDQIELERFALRGPEVDFDLQGAHGVHGDPKSFMLKGEARNSSGRAVLRIWPEAVAPKVRVFLVEHVREALVKHFTLDMNFSGKDLEGSVSGAGIDPNAMLLTFSVAGGRMSIGDGLPHIGAISLDGRVDGVSAVLTVPQAKVAPEEGRVLNLGNGDVRIGNFWNKLEIAQVDFKVRGRADALGAFLQSPAIVELAGADLNPDNLDGTLDLKAHLSIPIKEPPSIDKLPIRIEGKINNFAMADVWNDEAFSNADMTVAYVDGDLSVKGSGIFSGAPTTVDIRKTKTGGEGSASLTLDDVARKSLGLPIGSALKGPVVVRVGIPMQKNKKGNRIEIDLTKATVDQLLPGWAKPSGKPGKITFDVLPNGGGTVLKDISIDSGSVQIRGTADFSGDGDLVKADFPTLKIAQGDDMRVQVERSGTMTKVVLRGNNGDARALIKALSKDDETPSSQGGRVQSSGAMGGDFDIDAALNIATGFAGEALTNGSYKATLRNGVVKQLSVNARLGPAAVTVDSLQKDGVTQITFKSGDAGRILRLLDVYSRVAGGELILSSIVSGKGAQSGYLIVTDFWIRNEPGLKRIIPTQSHTIMVPDSKGVARPQQIDVNEVAFSKARVQFSKNAGKLEFRDAAIWGQQLGFTLSGFIDYRKDLTDIVGTYIPAYGLNNAFANVPIFGPILGGGRNEGLFAVNFRMSGSASSPVLTVSPLSAVAPGFLRKVFGEIENGARGSGDVPPPLPRTER